MTMSKHKNALITSSSPYLRQHAHNPVDWKEWTPETLKEAQTADKPILLSIGYSACHWCHVMAHESFEDEAVAKIMNEFFINIKVDREERPDVDHIYMEAIQSMGVNGGWPLNVFLTPDQKPFYGGTYFPNEGWKRLLISVNDAFQKNREKLNQSAEQFTQAINKSPLSQLQQLPERSIAKESFSKGYEWTKKRFDPDWGGFNGAPKFPMPSFWVSLATVDYLTDRPKAVEHLLHTTLQMCNGGIYDHIGGGFARYSVDDQWHVPHFEKMLYDNGQLLSLLALSYQLSQDKVFLSPINETVSWLLREMQTEDGGYYSALDADSEGVEGKFYVWNESEIDQVAGVHKNIIKKYFDVSNQGNWEETNVLRKLHQDEDICKEFSISESELHELIKDFRLRALKLRSKRIRPGLDDKVIASWNGLTLTGLCDAYRVDPEKVKESACHSLFSYIRQTLIKDDILLHTAKGEIEGFADDYSMIIQGLIHYYETFFDLEALKLAEDLLHKVHEGFFDPSDGFYFYVSRKSEQLIAQKKDIYDNVIPSSNAVLSYCFVKLGKLLDRQDYMDRSAHMIKTIIPLIEEALVEASFWAIAAGYHAIGIPEIAIIGDKYDQIVKELWQQAIPIFVICASKEVSDLPLLQHKVAIEDKTTIYICQDKACQRPVNTVIEAIEQIDMIWSPTNGKPE
jgi:uncharacterized protein YyaL (SSP411 family)